MTGEEFYELWLALASCYPNFCREQGEQQMAATFRMYAMMLSDFERPMLEAAVKQHIAGCKWFPTVAELRQGVDALIAPPQKSAMDAWAEVTSAFNAGGQRMLPGGNGYETPAFADPITQRIVNSMGWNTLCLSENQMADRAQFIHAYTAMAEQAADDRKLLPVVRELDRKSVV